MKQHNTPHRSDGCPSDPDIAMRAVGVLAKHHLNNERIELIDLATQIEVRRVDLRRVLCSLEAEGYVQADDLVLTLPGFALGISMLKSVPAGDATPDDECAA